MRPIQKTGAEPAAPRANPLLGEAAALLEQLGAMDPFSVLDGLGNGVKPEGIDTLPRLSRFLQSYQTELLSRVELPFIIRACGFAANGFVRELIELDAQLGQVPQLAPFAAASRRIGCAQLERLRPLKDNRVVKRYIDAVDSGKAQAWHPLVYGLTVAIYSLPHRQALVHYGEAALCGLACAAARSKSLPETAVPGIIMPLLAKLPAMADAALGQNGRL